MAKQVLLATSNLGKFREIEKLLSSEKLELVAPNKIFQFLPSVIENGSTFEANALIKAQTYAQASQLPTIAEDSGLEVWALNNRPGVKSARYQKGSDQDRYLKLLAELEGITDRRARFTTVACFFEPKTVKTLFFTGQLAGEIAQKPAGEAGFGYDPIFIPQGFNQTLAELGIKVKNKISHRYQAFTQLNEYFAKKL